MTVTNFFLGFALFLIGFGSYIWFKQAFSVLPNEFYANVSEDKKIEFIKYFGKGVFVSGICILIVILDLFSNDIIKWSAFGFTLAYSDLFIRLSRKLNKVDKIVETDNNTQIVSNGVTTPRFKFKKVSAIALVGVLGIFVFGGYLIHSFYDISIFDSPFEKKLVEDEVLISSVYISMFNQNFDLDEPQLTDLVNILNNIEFHKEISNQSNDFETIYSVNDIFFTIIDNSGNVFEIQANDDILLVIKNGHYFRYLVDEWVCDALAMFVYNLIS